MSEVRRTVGILAFSQIASWGALYYAFSVVSPHIEKETGWRSEQLFGAFSLSLLIAGILATPIGILIDRHGGRAVMTVGSLVCSAGLVLLAHSYTLLEYYLAWVLLGIAMSMTLYEAAFATINRIISHDSRRAISNLTLFAGFASTIFWPLTYQLNDALGWRNTYLVYAAVQLFVCLPMHMLLSQATSKKIGQASFGQGHSLSEAILHPAFWKLAIAFSLNMFIFAVLSVHLIPLLQDMGHAAKVAVLLSTVIGPMQVLGRIAERTIVKSWAPAAIGKFCFGALPAALTALIFFGTHAWAVAAFCMLYGLSNGILTIVRGTLPLELFGRKNYGAISGALAGPSLISKAAGPLVAAAILQSASSPTLLLAVLLATALISAIAYTMAIHTFDTRRPSPDAASEEAA